MNEWTTAIDGYCERLGPGFWAEPVNAVTNIAFFIAAWAGWQAWQQARAANSTPPGVLVPLLCLLAALIGTGSFLFHTFAQRWAALADVLPISLFILTAVATILSRLISLRVWGVLLGVAGFLVFVFVWRQAIPPWIFGKSSGYVPGWLALVSFAALFLALGGERLRASGTWLAVAGITFTISLFFRGQDMEVCETFPLGTHFLWHLLNGVVLWSVIMAGVRAPLSPRAGAPTG